MWEYMKNIYESNDGDLFAIEKQLRDDVSKGHYIAVNLISGLSFTEATQFINLFYNHKIKP